MATGREEVPAMPELKNLKTEKTRRKLNIGKQHYTLQHDSLVRGACLRDFGKLPINNTYHNYGGGSI